MSAANPTTHPAPVTPVTPAAACPECGAEARGRFCSSCGIPLDGAACPTCRAPLTKGARFCHRCGTAAGGKSRGGRGVAAALPWTIASIALVSLVALIAGQRFDRSPVAATTSDISPGRAPDISALSPAERADRLFNRVMRYDEQGKRDSVDLFAPMAMASYEMLGSLAPDQRYHLGRVAEAAGMPGIAKAHADTILAATPAHLLGLVLAARAAEKAGDDVARRSYLRRLVAAYPAESAKGRDEYAQHKSDIATALAAASTR